MNITAILPVSRTKYLNRVLESLKNQTLKPNNLLVIFDGSDSDFAETRNAVVGVDFDTVLCVRSNNKNPAFSIPDRRRHIVNIHNQARDLIADADWVFSIEDDGILPPNALRRLYNVVKYHTDAGMVTGVELGRWGVPYVGAWTVDDVNNVNIIQSIDNMVDKTPYTVDEIDACGLYCALIRADYYRSHEFSTDNGLGPDVNLGIYLRSLGFKNYIDWGVPVTHMTLLDGEEILIPANSKSTRVTLRLLSGSTWQASR